MSSSNNDLFCSCQLTVDKWGKDLCLTARCVSICPAVALNFSSFQSVDGNVQEQLECVTTAAAIVAWALEQWDPPTEQCRALPSVSPWGWSLALGASLGGLIWAIVLRCLCSPVWTGEGCVGKTQSRADSLSWGGEGQGSPLSPDLQHLCPCTWQTAEFSKVLFSSSMKWLFCFWHVSPQILQCYFHTN